jgi:phospholipid/cholesterol/gamma-HCH transport system substrate-binding protein
MEEKKKVSISELKVGVFVIVASIVLAAAIFTIGSQVGLFEDTFVAVTYLNNVSGLKPGDIVLLGGVEAGNVRSVDILKPDEMPDTEENLRNRDLIQRLEGQQSTIQQRLDTETQEMRAARERFEAVTQDPSTDADTRQRLQRRLEELESTVENTAKQLDRLRERAGRTRAELQNIVVYLTVKSEYRDWIRTDSSISLGSVGLLGDKYVEISLGREPGFPEAVEETVAGPFGIGERQRSVLPIVGRTQSGFQELITGANDVLANMEGLSSTLQDIMLRFEEGEGTIGKFFNDPSLYNNLNQAVSGAKITVDHVSRLIKEIAEGDGTLANIVQERKLYDDVSQSVENLKSVLARIDEGEGTLGKIIQDPSVYDNADKVMANVEGITARIEAGEGTLGKLSTDDQLYADLRRTLDEIASFMQDIEEGKGTLGRLAKDEQLYENLNEVSSEVVKLLYDFRQNPKKFLTIKFELF